MAVLGKVMLLKKRYDVQIKINYDINSPNVDQKTI